jgi:dTDP-4-amino-4,6-dideoxygalactose transaminase
MTTSEMTSDSDVSSRKKGRIDAAIAEMISAYGKPQMAFVATGMAALELALTDLKIGPGDKVVVPVEACYSVAASVLRVGAHPVFIDVGKTLVLAFEDLPVDQEFRAIIAVHSFGLPCNVSLLRQHIGQQVPIIEDASLAFGLVQTTSKLGSDADIVVASLGTGKSVDIGVGGVLLSEHDNISPLLDRRSSASRVRDHPPLPYPLSPVSLRLLPRALRQATIRLGLRRDAVARIRPRLQSLGFKVWAPDWGDQPCWHRLPVWAPPKLKQAALKANFIVDAEVAQLPHAVDVPDLPMFVGRCSRIGHGDRRGVANLLLLRTELNQLDQWTAAVERLVEGGASYS